ncbi:MAG: hypoxanthine phosphoribosyltransferase [Clostridiales bacterium]|nr:hypoxanthine phosphoribosyltransferase [Clostridiales bacterium]
MHNNLEKIILNEEQIAAKVKEAAAWLDNKFKDAQYTPIAICVLKGSVFFFCDVTRAMQTPVHLDFMRVSSYGNSSKSSGMPHIIMDLSYSVQDRDVILIEDIVDSGYTLSKMKELMLGRGAKSFTVVTLLNKPSRRKLPVKADFSCFEVANEFVVGYGLDYAEQYRNLPYIGVLKREIYETDK